MRISKAADYALHAVIHIAEAGGRRVTIEEIAEKRPVPQAMIGRILRNLVLGGVIKGFRGVHGGYELGAAANKLSALDVIEAIDGPLAVNRYKSEVIFSKDASSSLGLLNQFFSRFEKYVRRELQQQTIAEFVRVNNR